MSVVMVFGILVLLGLLAFALLNRTVAERQVITHLLRREIAFNAAEGGLEKALLELKRDFANDTTGNPSWADGIINGINTDTTDSNYYPLYDDTISLGEGSYFVELKNEPDGLGGFLTDEICVRSTGITDRGGKRVIEAYVEIENLSPWNNVITAGTGQIGKVISGNVEIHGSVHILGEGLIPSDNAIEMGGGAGIRNNYEGMPSILLSKVPPLDTTIFNGEVVRTLKATLRVKHGRVYISDAAATVGEPDSPGDTIKETMDGVYVTDGYEGLGGGSNVYSDNGTDNPYDIEDVVQFPSLFDPYTDPETDSTYARYLDYLSAKALHITEDTISSDIADFSYSDTLGNSITWNSQDSLDINGIIYIGSDLTIGTKDNAIQYDGKGTIVSTGNITIEGHLLTQGEFASDDALGLIAAGNMYLAGPGLPHLKIMGAFYAESKVTVQKQTDIVGSLVSNYFSMLQVPCIYQVPALATNLPPGIIEGDPVWLFRVRTRIR